MAMEAPPFTPGPRQFIYGDLFDHGEDGHANGFTVLMASARVAELPDDEEPEAGADRIGNSLVIHQIRIAEDVFPEDAGRAEAEANARLISAAPDLYDACRQAAELFEDDEGISAVLRAALNKSYGTSA